jgi:hypothetical protein
MDAQNRATVSEAARAPRPHDAEAREMRALRGRGGNDLHAVNGARGLADAQGATQTPARAPAAAGFLRELEALNVPGATDKLHRRSIALAQRYVAGKADAEAIAWVAQAFEMWSHAGGKVSLELCLRLPQTPGKVAMLLRDHWLTRAVEGMAGDTPWERCCALSRCLSEFTARGPWQRWKQLQDPPRAASALHAALFYVAKTGAGRGLSAKQIYRRLMDTF